MKLPSGDRAIVEHEKLMGYVLNPDHPVGRHHAYLFERLLGITRANSKILRQALLDAASTSEVEKVTSNPFGTKYRLRCPISGPRGTVEVISVWVLNVDSDSPRLVTCFVE